MSNEKENATPEEEEEEVKKNTVESLLNYECDDSDDGTDWET